MTSLTPPLKWAGGKRYLSDHIIERFPPHTHYVEPYAGGLAVLLKRKPGGHSEVVNDLDGRLTNFWKVLQHPGNFEQFQRRAQAIPFSETEWNDAEDDLYDDDPVIRAIAFFVRVRQSLAGRQGAFSLLTRTRVRHDVNAEADAWVNAVDGLRDVHVRLRHVVVLNQDALDVIRSQDGPATLFYCDPPYVHGTRTDTTVYQDAEMSDAHHRELLEALNAVLGKVILSGYLCPLYDEMLADWNRDDFEVPNHASNSKTKRKMIESIWTNYSAPKGLFA